MTVTANVAYSRIVSKGIETNSEYGSILGSAIAFNPTIPVYASEAEAARILAEPPTAVVDKDGRVFSMPPSGFQELTNPLAQLATNSNSIGNSDKFVANFGAELDIMPGLKFKTNYGVDLSFWRNRGYGFEQYKSSMNQTLTSWVNMGMNEGLRWQTENYFSYNKQLGKHYFAAVLGQSAMSYSYTYVSGTDYQLKETNPAMAYIDSAIGDTDDERTSGGTGGYDVQRLASYFFRFDYNFDERYMLQFTIRRDGSSRFGPGHKWATFPAVSAGWNVTNEPWFREGRPDWINQLKLRIMKQAESNNSRASQMAYAFVEHRNWGDVVNEIDELAKITKKDIVDFANRICKDNNYVIVYKQQDTPDPVTKVQKPAITPIYVSRDNESPFLASIKESANKAKPIQPQFINFGKDLKKGKTANGSDVLYVKNVENGTFNLQYRFEFGSSADKTIDLASDLVEYLNTDKHSAEQLKEEFYRLACSWGISVGGRAVTVSISGLAENMEKAMTLVEEVMATCQPNDEALKMLVERAIKSRTDNKTNQRAAFSALNRYGIYGEEYIKETNESDAELRAYTARQLTDALHNLFNYKHRVLYYGPLSLKDATAAVNRIHKVKPTKDVPANKIFQPQAVNENQVLFVDYNAKNTYVTEYFRGEHFNTAQVPGMNLFNEYFGGSMNAIVFQEMREKHSLAYSASSHYTYGTDKDGYFFNSANVITQNDKLMDALNAYEELFNDMPQAEANFKLAKDALLAGSRTARTTKFGIISAYLTCEQMGWKEPLRKQNFQAYQNMTMKDLVDFQQKHIKGQKKTYLILGKESEMDFNALSKFGKVKKLTLDEIFGY